MLFRSLRDAGFHDVRVRHHELKQGHLARIEIGPEELPRLMDGGRYRDIEAAIRAAGYQHVTLDLQGYRRGSLNIALMKPGGRTPVTSP